MMFQIRVLILSAVLWVTAFNPVPVLSWSELPSAKKAASSFPGTVLDRTGSVRSERAGLDAVCLFTLKNGVCAPQFFNKKELVAGQPLESRGHVVGVVVFGPDDMRVHLNDQPFRPIQSNSDGSFEVKGFGRINPSELKSRPQASNGGESVMTAELPHDRPPSNGFYYFPKVLGDTVSPMQHFELQLTGRGSTQTVAIHHQPQQSIDLNMAGAANGIASPVFHYIGDRLDMLSVEGDFHDRLAAIAQGIQSVEATFHTDLIPNINLIDMNDKNNALTSEGGSTIWFYIETVLGTSKEELYRMASHEALHQLVYRMRLTQSAVARRFFADLWGLDDFSVSRFQLVTTGWFDTHSAQLSPKSDLFFAFINEKNFMHGMHGGHSHDNLDEFLTSFIHSLLYVDNLAPNLQIPVKLYGSDKVHPLNNIEKAQILSTYRQALDVLRQATEGAGAAGMEMRELSRFLKDRQRWIEGIRP